MNSKYIMLLNKKLQHKLLYVEINLTLKLDQQISAKINGRKLFKTWGFAREKVFKTVCIFRLHIAYV